jgi:hypothetical protein
MSRSPVLVNAEEADVEVIARIFEIVWIPTVERRLSLGGNTKRTSLYTL